MAGDRAALLRQARHVDGAETLAFQVRRLAEHGRERHHAGAADARDQHRVGVVELGKRRLGQARQHAGDAAVADRFPGLLHLGAVHGHEARAEAVEAGEVLVAGRLVDGALGAELGLERQHGHAIRLDAAVAATLAHGWIDEHALVGIGEQATLAPAALLGRAGLVVNEHGDAGHLAQLFLQPAAQAMCTGTPCGMARRILVGSSVPDALDALRQHLVTSSTVMPPSSACAVAAGVVVEDLERDVDAGARAARIAGC
jgi:hypothetical protein